MAADFSVPSQKVALVQLHQAVNVHYEIGFKFVEKEQELKQQLCPGLVIIG